MYKTILISLISTLFIGCSSTSALKYFKSDEIQAKAIQHTKKADVLVENQQKALVWATYLNNIDHEDFKMKEETFLVSLYFINNKSQDYKENGYSFKLNDRDPIKIEEIKKDDPRYKILLKNNPWAKIYLVEFERMKRVYDLTLELTDSNTSSAQLKFQK